MTKHPNEWSGVPLAQNMLLLVYPFAVGSGDGLPVLRRPFASLEQYTVADFYAALNKNGGTGGEPVWEPLAAEQARKHLSPDLHPVVDRILHGGSTGNLPEQGHLPLRVRGGFLTDDFAIELPDAARERLEAAGVSPDGAHYIRFRFHDIHAYLPATGIGLLTLEVEIKAPLESEGTVSTDLLLEGIYALSHPESRGHRILHGKLQKKSALEPLAAGERAHVVEAAPDLPEPALQNRFGLKRSLGGSLGAAGARGYSVLVGGGDGESCLVLREGAIESTTLGQLAQALLGGVAGNCDRARFFSFAYARTPDTVAPRALRELALRLSGNYNSHYAVTSSEVRKKSQTIFSNIHFAATLQGGAVVVSADSEGAPGHLLEYYKNAVRCSYIPLGLLAYHEYLQLKGLLRNCAVHWAADLEEEAARIKESRERLLRFRLYYRFSHVSDMAHHNTVHAAWRAALAADMMLDELSADMAEADGLYKAAIESRQAERWREEQRRYEQDKAADRQKEADEKKRHHELEERWKLASTVVAAFGGFTFIHEFAEIILRLYFSQEKWLLLLLKGDGLTAEAVERRPEYAAAIQFHHQLHSWEIGIAIGAGVLALAVGAMAWKKGPKLGHH